MDSIGDIIDRLQDSLAVEGVFLQPGVRRNAASRQTLWSAAVLAVSLAIPAAAVRLTAQPSGLATTSPSRSVEESGTAVPVAQILDRVINTSSLTSPGSAPFYLKATITDHPDSDLNGEFEQYWVSPTKWRRSIRTKAFSQTLIVNGDKVYEQDSADYFPSRLEMLVTSMVDPIPAWAADQLRRVDFKIMVPDGKPGQCEADTYVNDKERYVLSLRCEDGALWHAYLPGWSTGVYDDYRRFHGKLIGFKTKDNPLVARFDALRDLGQPDESLFAVVEPTPQANRIRTQYIRGEEYLKSVAKAPEIKWPQATNGPDSGTISISVDVDRNGHVRWAHSYSHEELKDFALEQVRGWEFKPFSVDGSPVQVSTTLNIDFKSELKPDPTRLPPAKSFFDRARTLSDFRRQGIGPIHLGASFKAFGNVELTGEGTYEETWVSDTQWRREATLSGNTVIESRDGDNLYRSFKGRYSPRRVDDVMDILTARLPGHGEPEFDESEWMVAKVRQGDVPLLRVWHGDFDPLGEPSWNVVAYSFAPDSGLLRTRVTQGTAAAFNDFVPFAGKPVARHIELAEHGLRIAEITIERIEKADTPSQGYFTIVGVKPTPADADDTKGARIAWEPLKIIKQVQPDYPSEARSNNLHGTVVLEAHTDEHGHVRTVTVKESAGEVLDRAAITAVMQWEFAPQILKGRPVQGYRSVALRF